MKNEKFFKKGDIWKFKIVDIETNFTM